MTTNHQPDDSQHRAKVLQQQGRDSRRHLNRWHKVSVQIVHRSDILEFHLPLPSVHLFDISSHSPPQNNWDRYKHVHGKNRD